jgi:hypothetical protein
MHLNNADHTFSDPRDWETVIADVLSQLADL